MKRLRICQLITELRPAGAERCVYELSRRLDRERFAVQVAALRGGAVADRLEQAGIGVTVLNARNKLDLSVLPRLVKLLRRERIDLLHTHLFHADLAGRIAAGLAGVRNLVHTVHVAEGRFRPWQYAWARVTANRCDRIVCVSQAVRDHHALKSHLPLWRYEVIYNGIDTDAYAPNPQRREELRRQWGVGDDEILIAFVGRLDYQKNLPMLLEAFGRLRQSRNDIRLVIAGDGPEAPILEKFLREDKPVVFNTTFDKLGGTVKRSEAELGRGISGCVHHGQSSASRKGHYVLLQIDRATQQGRVSGSAIWLGRIDDVPGLLSAADIFVQPSRWEGFGLAAAEAMAAGLPVIGTKVPGLTELIEEGASGVLIDSEDIDALTTKINQLADNRDERIRLGAAGQKRVKERFSIEANVTAHERLYENVCRGER